MIVRRCQPSESRELSGWIGSRHYLRFSPPGYVAAFEFLLDGARAGGALLGRPTARSMDPDRILELTRFYCIDAAPKNSESQALAKIRRQVRTWFPRVKLLLAYSDPVQGHTGVIYEADGWAPFGMTDRNHGRGWQARPGRREEKQSRKQRWVRTP
jgi:hypothetical protein